jgi:hypothetical protein
MKLVFFAVPFWNPPGAHVEILCCGFLGIFSAKAAALSFKETSNDRGW